MNIFAKAGQAIRRFVAYDSPVSQTVLTVWGVFVTAVCAWLFLLPQLAFELLVGWQSTHLALWLGTLSLITVGPMLRGLLTASTAILAEKGYPSHLARGFFDAIRKAPRALWALWAISFPVGLFVAYDVALAAGSAARMVPAIVLGVLMALLLAAAGVLAQPSWSVVELVTASLTAMARRVWLPLTWLFLLAICLLLTRIPLLGPTVALFVPALWGLGVALVNGMWRFGR
ncbi:hypothetical protein [Bifidobacterium avesanii]|uniref:DUF624 domain-containing protein n=1 Tax=Bifidobacterium avesanii TaxID=1798157 RepID=A0A7K3TI86_9BIFI|nr:hypothetical protein [Bifidobacterium avesanii]KAB8291049.1 hypothetical protein DSM100685_1311 [Bifidobacterium avesanii]NEG78815.1 hypothetical protein [Bifidobacterium avesanii]